MATPDGSDSGPEMGIDVSPLEVADVAHRTAHGIRAALPPTGDVSVYQLHDLTGLSERQHVRRPLPPPVPLMPAEATDIAMWERELE
jgi:hypothetical protein